MSDAAYRLAAISSESMKQNAIAAAMADFQVLVDDVPALVKVAASENKPESVANKIVAEAMVVRDAAVRTAERQHYERLAAAGQHYGIANGHTAGNNPHAQLWLKTLLVKD
jgi:hypothetical protein